MRRHPIEQHADTGVVAAIDQQREFLRRAEQRVRRELAEQLIAPRSGERVVHDRHELDMGKAHARDIIDELVGELRPVERAAVGMAQPRPRMHLVDRDRRVGRLPFGPLGAPGFVRPAERRRVVDDRGRRRRRLGPPSDRIGLYRQQSRHRRRAARICRARRAPSRGTKISQTPAPCRSRIGWRRPSQLLKSPTTETRRAFGAQTAKRTPGTPSTIIACAPRQFARSRCLPSDEQIDVEFAQQRPERIGVFGLLDRPAPIDPQQIGARRSGSARQKGRCCASARSSVRRLGSSRATAVTAKAPGQHRADDLARLRCDAGRAPRTDRGCALRRRLAAPARGSDRHPSAGSMTGATMRAAIRARPCSGMPIQLGRLAAS